MCIITARLPTLGMRGVVHVDPPPFESDAHAPHRDIGATPMPALSRRPVAVIALVLAAALGTAVAVVRRARKH